MFLELHQNSFNLLDATASDGRKNYNMILSCTYAENHRFYNHPEWACSFPQLFINEFWHLNRCYLADFLPIIFVPQLHCCRFWFIRQEKWGASEMLTLLSSLSSSPGNCQVNTKPALHQANDLRTTTSPFPLKIL